MKLPNTQECLRNTMEIAVPEDPLRGVVSASIADMFHVWIRSFETSSYSARGSKVHSDAGSSTPSLPSTLPVYTNRERGAFFLACQVGQDASIRPSSILSALTLYAQQLVDLDNYGCILPVVWCVNLITRSALAQSLQ